MDWLPEEKQFAGTSFTPHLPVKNRIGAAPMLSLRLDAPLMRAVTHALELGRDGAARQRQRNDLGR